MGLPRECYQMQQTISTNLPHLSQSQLTGLTWWVCGTILVDSACQNVVAQPFPAGATGTVNGSISESGW